jgi:hypothetical protein
MAAWNKQAKITAVESNAKTGTCALSTGKQMTLKTNAKTVIVSEGRG